MNVIAEEMHDTVGTWTLKQGDGRKDGKDGIHMIKESKNCHRLNARNAVERKLQGESKVSI